MVRLGRGYLKMVGMAPEIPGIDVIRDYFKQQNVTIAIAHTDGNYAVTKNAIANGATVATHLCNVMTGIHHRDFGCLGACLTDQRVWAELICDGLHVCNEMLKFVYDTKGKEQIMMISDCTALSGLKPGFYENEVLGGRISVTADGFVLDENGRLRGSSMPVIHGMRNLVVNCHIPLNDVVRMASYNPAAFHGCLAEKGSLEPGKDADFIIVNDDLRLISTFKAGNKCFDVKEGRNYFSPYIMRKLEKEI
ncbi:N-acetylglucosamine-6-phosphate deacetylase [bioreactor metagenome]|uniref:N-acetylglucosamine-6-phosphate deacetylase n=1 Tax=bioreactor metagenome TaxID=1076179 RepID=A0A645DGV2_9ZZZZ